MSAFFSLLTIVYGFPVFLYFPLVNVLNRGYLKFIKYKEVRLKIRAISVFMQELNDFSVNFARGLSCTHCFFLLLLFFVLFFITTLLLMQAFLGSYKKQM